ncbi:transcription factor bHLH92 [Cornus florida]|uniref:transcription factor bHLH92 n=1 Tax=Cornus florida TaxID=4283 RepID=UPI0028991ADD|nr:transcription factor bHLH92 [Cornus florida]
MDQFFKYDTQDEIFWMEAAFPANRSAFVRYTDRPIAAKSMSTGLNNRNLIKRMIDLLIRRSRTPLIKGKEHDTERSCRHMINERMRREKQKQSYLALHSVLPPGTKNDKKSIVQTAAKEVEDLQRYKEELERRKEELEGILATTESVRGEKIRLKVPNPSSGIDSMVEVLKCLKSMGSKTRAIQSVFSPHEFSAVLNVQSQVGAGEIEKAVHGALHAVEKKFRFHFLQD